MYIDVYMHVFNMHVFMYTYIFILAANSDMSSWLVAIIQNHFFFCKAAVVSVERYPELCVQATVVYR